MTRVMYSGAVLAALIASASAGEEDLSSPMIKTAMEFLGRASTTSNVLTLNLTNLLILLILARKLYSSVSNKQTFGVEFMHD